ALCGPASASRGAPAGKIVAGGESQELDAVVSGAAALVNPSAREGFGLVVAEAAALGVPSVVVAGDDNASVELVRRGVNGAVATDATAEALGAAIRDVVDAGEELRRSTAEWFARERETRNLAGSVDELLRRAERLRR
ncbi:glycosyltransferase, partial [Agromyces binzhouensis]